MTITTRGFFRRTYARLLGEDDYSEVITTLSADPVPGIKLTGKWFGQPAAVYEVLGRRDGAFEASPTLTDVVEFPITGGKYPELISTEALEIVSSSAADTAAGTGARSVKITYLDVNGDLQTVTVTPNGTTPVSLGAVRMLAIWWMNVISVGSGGSAAGNIDLRMTNGSTVIERIIGGGNQSLSARIKIPRNHTGYITQFVVSNANNTVSQDVRLRATVERGGTVALDDVYLFKATAYLGGAATQQFMVPYEIVPALADAKVSTVSGSTNSGRLSVEFTLIIRQND